MGSEHGPAQPGIVAGVESFRGTLVTRAADGGRHTVIVLRRDSRVWLCLNGAWKHSSVMTGAEAGRLIELLGRARISDDSLGDG